jgi:inorganic pyrophosphatase
MKFPKPFTEKGSDHVYAVIETPKGSRNKYDYKPELDLYQLCKVLPAGTCFPLDFGFIPHTLAADGDPLDILVMTDAPAHMGCIIECKVIGVFEATQKEKGKKAERNDRLLAVSIPSLDHAGIKNIKDVNKHFIDELVHFFEYYNMMCGKKFKLIGIKGPEAALALIKKQISNKA